MPDGCILALDLSTSIGWAAGCVGDPVPAWGVWELPGPDRTFGYRFNAFENCIADALTQKRPATVYVERPIPQRDNNVVTAEITLGMHAILSMLCFQHDLDLQRPTVDTVRNKVIGRSHLTDAERALRLKVKPTIVRPWIEMMGWGITQPDAADAAIVWAFAIGIRAPRPPRMRRAA